MPDRNNVMEHRSTPAHDSLAPSRWIERFAHLIPEGARVLDVASGHGRHARYFAQRRAKVLAVDRDAQALASLHGIAGVDTRVMDLEIGAWPLGNAMFDAIVVVNYLHRPSCADLLAALTPDGALLYETFAVGNEAYGRPSNPDFLLCEDELLDLVRGRLTIVAFEQGLSSDRDMAKVVQRIAAVGRARRWPPAVSL